MNSAGIQRKRKFSSVDIRFGAEGIYLADLNLWLDPKKAVPAAWLSHAHSDHARGVHGLAMGTQETLAIYEERWPAKDLQRVLQPVRPREPFRHGPATLTAFPAAHILGAAMLLVEHEGESVLYTGDVKRRVRSAGGSQKYRAATG